MLSAQSSAITHKSCGKFCGESPQSARKWRCLWGFQRFEPRRSNSRKVNEYLTLAKSLCLSCNKDSKLTHWLDKPLVFHMGI